MAENRKGGLLDTLIFIAVIVGVFTALFCLLRFMFRSPKNFATVVGCFALIVGVYMFVSREQSSARSLPKTSAMTTPVQAVDKLPSSNTAEVVRQAQANVTSQGNQETSPLAVEPVPPRIVPSFDCAKAYSPAEIAICNDDELATLDRELAQFYQQAKATTTDRETFARQTREAWEWRENNCFVKECLMNWYQERKAAMQQVIQNGKG